MDMTQGKETVPPFPQDGAFDSEVESIAPVDFNVTGLAVGPHLIGIRYKDNNSAAGGVANHCIRRQSIGQWFGVQVVEADRQWIRHHSSRGIFCGY